MDTSSLKRCVKGAVLFLAGIVFWQTVSHTRSWFEHHYEDLKLEIHEVRREHETLRSHNEQLERQIDSLMNMHPYKKRKH